MINIIYIAVGDIYGSGKALLNILKESALNNRIVPFVVMGSDMGLKKELEYLNIPYKIIPYRFEIYPESSCVKDYIFFLPRLFKTLYKNKKALKEIKEIAFEINADIIHTNTGVYRIGEKVSRKTNIPHVWHIREYQDIDMGYKLLGGKNKFCNLLNKINNYPIAITNGIFNHFKMGINARIIYDGVRNSKEFQFIPIKEKYFLYVGNISEHKGVAQLINSFIEFAKSNQDYSLFIVGKNEGTFSKSLNKTVHESGFSNRIFFLGFRSDVDILMAKATALIMASNWEAFGLTTAEAMFNGCLVIGKDSAGTKEQFDNGVKQTGSEIGIRYKTNEELVNSMKNITNNGIEYYFPMILNAQKTVVNLYSVEKNSKEIYKLYQKILIN